MNDTDSKPAGAGQSRLGLALSGGGFRAAFFHLGVLARMAELDLLRRVEVLSTVSGGSVIGAMYYLKVRKLLQQLPDNEIRTHHYLEIVSELEREFYDGVRRNLRTRTFANPIKNGRMYSRAYSRSDRIAELYTKFLFEPLVECDLLPNIPIRRTVIQPAGEAPRFKPFRINDGQTANDGRCNKVPVLLLNATTLNTGHNFRFTATWMGEVPTQGARNEIDQNTRLRRAYYLGDNLPSKYQDLPLGIAVAASTAVPGVFHPLALTDLYEGWTPQLVDGGVHDNQGIEGLLDAKCTDLIISDACGQMDDVPNPSTRMISVLKRSNTVMMDRVREEMYETAAYGQDSRVQPPVYFHLRQDLERPDLTWIGGKRRDANEQEIGGEISYDVVKSVQLLLSSVRTDLDSFSEVEAQALMADGYLIAKSKMNQDLVERVDPSCQADPQSSTPSWAFLRVEPFLRGRKLDPLFCRQLDIAGAIAFKVFKRFPWLCWTARASGVLVAAILLWHVIVVDSNDSLKFAQLLCEQLTTYQELRATVLALLAYGMLFLLPSSWRRVTMLRDLPRRLALGVGAATIATAAAWLHILVFDRLFLWQGRVDRLKGIPPG